MLTVECVDCFDRFVELQTAWNGLLERYTGADLLLTHEWLRMSWMVFCRQGRPYVLVVTDGDRLIGAVPLMVVRTRRCGVAVRVLSFLHGGGHYDRGDFIIVERVQDVLDAVFSHLNRRRSEWDMAVWAGLPDRSPVKPWLERTARGAGISLSGSSICNEALVLPVRGSWDDFLGQRTRNFRRSLTGPEQKLSRQGRVEVVTARNPEQVKDAVRMLYRLHEDNRRAAGVSLTESDRVSEEAGTVLAALVVDCGEAAVTLLQLDGRAIAGLFSITYRGHSYALVIKHDERYSAYSPGRLVLAHFIRDMWDRRIEAIDFLMRWPYLERWTDHSERYLRVAAFHRGAFSQGLRYARAVAQGLRSVTRGRDSVAA